MKAKARAVGALILVGGGLVALAVTIRQYMSNQSSLQVEPFATTPGLTVRIDNLDRRIYVGKESKFEFTFRNTGKHLSIVVPLHTQDYSVLVVDSNGKICDMLSAGGLPKVRSVWLGTNCTWSTQYHWTFDKPGLYRVKLLYPGGLVRYYLETASTVSADSFRGELETNELLVTVRPRPT